MLSESSTIILYFCITIFCFIFASASNKKIAVEGQIYCKEHKGCFVISWIVATFFLINSHIGTDYNSYISILHSVRWDNLFGFTNAEPGFKLLWLIFSKFSTDADLFLAIIKLFGISLAFSAIWKIRDEIDVGFSVLGYMCFVYFDSFNLIRMIFAVNICIFAFGKLMKEKNTQAALLSVIAVSIHTAALFFLIAVIAYLYILRQGKIPGFRMFILVLGLSVILVCVGTLFNYLVGNFGVFRHYTKYTLSTDYGFSPVLILRYLPVIYCVYFSWKNLEEKSKEKIGIVFLVIAIFVSLLSYSIKTVTRANSFFYVLQFILMPLYLTNLTCQRWDNYSLKRKGYFNIRDSRFLTFVYFMFFFIIKMLELGVSEIQCYKFFWL